MKTMTSHAIQLLLAIALCPALSGLGGPLRQTAGLDEAYEALLKASAVNDIAVGIGAVRSTEYDAFESLWLAGKQAEPYALRLTRSGGTPASRVYGFLLLVELDREAAEAELPRLQQESTTVLVLNGCLGTRLTVGDLAGRLWNGEFVIMTPTGKWSRQEMARSPKGLPN